MTVPEDGCAELEAASAFVSNGRGMIPVTARVAATTWQTSLFPKDGGYVVPVRTDVRRAERVDVGDTVTVRPTVDL